jgi:hypothetical protein
VGLPSSTADSVAESNVLCEPAPTLHLLLESRRDPPVVALRLPPANGFDPSGIRCPGRPIRVVFLTSRRKPVHEQPFKKNAGTVPAFFLVLPTNEVAKIELHLEKGL